MMLTVMWNPPGRFGMKYRVEKIEIPRYNVDAGALPRYSFGKNRVFIYLRKDTYAKK